MWERQLRFWLIGAAFFIAVLYFLNSILLPFIAGMALAYLLDPLCDRLEEMGLSRLWATLVVCIVFLLIVVLPLLLLVPYMIQQAAGLITQFPVMIEELREQTSQFVFFLQSSLNEESMVKVREALTALSEQVVALSGGLLTGLISQGLALFNILALLVVTPVVTFFLLRDWDRLVEKVDSWLPRPQVPTIRGLAREVDEILAGFIRGQGLVCLSLGIFYSIGLTLAGLDYSLLIGLIAGVLSFVPYVGAFIGLILSVGVAFIQFDDGVRIAIVAGIFFLGQALEGNILTPKLVGDRIRLHPVWVMFGLLAGGALFGFVGVLLAVPVSAIIGVGVRFLLSQYKQSVYYRGEG